MPDSQTTQEIATMSGVVLRASLRSAGDAVNIHIEKAAGPACLLHWGVVRAGGGAWETPPESAWPAGSMLANLAVHTPLGEGGVDIRLESSWRFAFLDFVLFDPKRSTWDSNQGRNYRVSLPAPPPREHSPSTAARALSDPGLAALADEIVDRETGAGSWTLMHRFHLAWDLLDRMPRDSVPGLALIFVWLRFSAIRQLDWQRNFNTKPRELAHAQDRLTAKLAERAAQADEATRPLIRMIATTLGRGGDGQRVRDGILEIMHRHHVKEVAGSFLEEWHQKLHNNTTPDDVVICEAYLEFLRRNGDQAAFYSTLEAGGVRRERLLGFERPIRSAPDFMPSLRDALTHDLGDFLGILRSVHSATDFGTALQAARGFVDENNRQVLDGVWRRRDEKDARSWLVRSITEVREGLVAEMRPGRAGARELLYLDLGLEELFRSIVERNLGEELSLDELVEWTALGLRNLVCTRKSEELSLCLRHLMRLLGLPRGGREWALHAQAVLERIRREIVRTTDEDSRLFQPIAEHLGQAFGAEPWTVQTFAEEVVRGRFEFAVSALLRKLDERLRQIAGVGHWQIVSRGAGPVEGVVECRGGLAEVQGQRFERNTVLLVGTVSGEEDIPGAVVAVLTPSAVDLMAHVAVRARNAGVLLATGFDDAQLADMRAKQGQWVRLTAAAEGEISVEDGQPTSQSAARPVRVSRPAVSIRPATAYVVSEEAFAATEVGAKSRNLRALRGRLPEWIAVPAGIALPYGVCERVLGNPINQARARRHAGLVAQLRDGQGAEPRAVLAELRKVILDLDPPSELEVELRKRAASAGIAWPSCFADAWQCIKLVWASKWNDRAHYSRRSMGVSDESLMMAVLVQEVVPADYAFVIHTANPITGDRDELVAEIVVGLGESLVGNHPGRAFGFCRRRSEGATRITSFPSKSVGLFGQGLMFRSDSSGEDLMGFAGAGLYDSFMLPQARHIALDYERDALLWNEELQRQMVEGVTQVGVAVEGVFGVPQDIEGVYSGGRFFVVQSRPQVGLDHG